MTTERQFLSSGKQVQFNSDLPAKASDSTWSSFFWTLWKFHINLQNEDMVWKRV